MVSQFFFADGLIINGARLRIPRVAGTFFEVGGRKDLPFFQGGFRLVVAERRQGSAVVGVLQRAMISFPIFIQPFYVECVESALQLGEGGK